MLTVGSLFSGIGGLDLGLERASMTVRWQSEIDPYCCRVLAKHWPHVPNLGDVKTIDWKAVEPVDLICGGYPCQPFSLAGVRRGEADPRHLWPFFRDALRVVRPRLVLLENVPGHLSLGFGQVLGDLADLGYDCEWDCIPAAAVGAPHLRYRIFVVAHTYSQGEPGQPLDAVTRSGVVVPDANSGGQRTNQFHVHPGQSHAPRGYSLSDGTDRYMADADSPSGRQAGHAQCGTGSRTRHGSPAEPGGRREEPDRSGNYWAVEPDVGRVAHGVPHRMERLRALGNAVVPQVAEWIGRRIMEAAA